MADEFRINAVIRVLDVLWSIIIITPLTIFYWGGTWKLLDLYLYPDNILSSSYVSLALGTSGCIGGYLVLPLLDTCVPSERICSFKHILISRVVIYILAFMVLNYWRGIWNLLDHSLGSNLMANGLCVACATVILIPLRSIGNVVSSPFAVELDVSARVYKPSTRFETMVSSSIIFITYILLILC